MAKRGWKTSVIYALLFAVALGLTWLSLKVYAPLVFPVVMLVGAGGVWIHRKAIYYGEDLAVLALKQKRLEAKAWYFESVITNSGNIIFTTDVDHRILKFNRGSERTFGLSQTDVLGKEVHTLFEDALEIKGLLAKVEETGAAEAHEMNIKQAGSREEIWISLSITRMLNRDKEVIGEVFNCSNISKRKQLETQLQEKNEQLLRLSITDSLTGLYNVRHLNAELGKLIKAHRRYPNRSISIALIDVDKFKLYNDTKGHQAGDHLLVMLSNIFQTELRQDMDSAYRYGGDEFVLLLPDTNGDGAKVICDRILVAFRKLHLQPTSLSIGIAQFAADENNKDASPSVKEFVGKADEAMYAVKSAGGDSIRVNPSK